jgi:acyl-CoA synthetase (NDP forming)
VSVRGLKQLVVPDRVIFVAPDGGAPAWARTAERNLFAGRFAGERLALGTLGEAPAAAVLPGVDALPVGGRLFLALVALPQPDPAGLIGRLHARGCRGVLLLGAGIGPMALDAEARRALQAQARELGGLRVVGPSRVGLILPRLGLNAGGTTFLPPAGGLAFVSQSDALTTAMLDWAAARDIGFSLVAALGDSMDVELGDLLDLLALDLNTRAILLHLEGVSDARRFMSAGRAAARAKPVIVLRAGRYAGFGDGTLDPRRLLERDLAYEAAFARAGMLRVRTVEELFATAGTLASGIGPRRVQEGALRRPPRRRVERGRAGAAGARRPGRGRRHAGPALAGTLGALAAELGPAQSLENPVDLGLEAGPDAFAAAVPRLLADGGVDAVLVVFSPGASEVPERYAEVVIAAGRQARAVRRPLLAAWLGEAAVGGARRTLAAAGVPTYATPEEAVRAFLDLVAYDRRQRLLRQVPTEHAALEACGGPAPRREEARALLRAALAAGRERLGAGEVDALLAAYGLPPPAPTAPAGDALELVAGVRLDERFGPVLHLAHGAPGAALLGETAAALPPLDRALAEALLEDTPVGRLLLRGGDPRLPDPAAAVSALVRLSRLVVEQPEVARVDLEIRLSVERGLDTLSASVGVAPAPPGDPAARLAVRPYPAELEERVTLKDGRQVRLRPIRPDDGLALRLGFRLMAPEDRRFRLFSPARELAPELAERLTQIDYDREMALVADDPDRPGLLLGGARVIMDPDGRRAEFSVTVRSDAKGAGARQDRARAGGGVRAPPRRRGGLGRDPGRQRADAGPRAPPRLPAPPRPGRARRDAGREALRQVGRRPSRGDRTGIRGCDS